MREMLILTLVLLTGPALSLGANLPGVTTTESYKNSAIMDKDGNYILFWKFNDTHVTFEVHVRTKGVRLL